LPEISDPRRQPARIVERRDEKQQLMTAVRRLPLPYRQVIVLLLEDMEQDEIAITLNLSAGNVRVRINRAKSMLKEWLQP
jgi:RNA polymerase sigma-70 factor (ECF subfamily)